MDWGMFTQILVICGILFLMLVLGPGSPYITATHRKMGKTCNASYADGCIIK